MVNRLTHHGSRLLQRGHHDKRRQLAVVLAGARHALVEALMAETLLPDIAGVRHRDEAVGDLPAVEALLQGFPRGVLDRPEKGDGHRPQFDVDVELYAGSDGRRFEAEPDRGEERVGWLAQPLDGRTGAGQPFGTDRRRLAK